MGVGRIVGWPAVVGVGSEGWWVGQLAAVGVGVEDGGGKACHSGSGHAEGGHRATRYGKVNEKKLEYISELANARETKRLVKYR